MTTTDEPKGFGRRQLFAGAGVAALAVALAACGSDDDTGDTAAPSGDSTDTTEGEGGADAAVDLKIAAFAAGLEALAVGTYKAALDAATAGKLGPVPPAGGEFVKTAMAQHKEAQQAWNAVLKSNGQPEVTTPDKGLKPTVDAEFAKVKDFGGAVKLAAMLEDIAAATYLDAISKLSIKEAITMAGQLNINDMQHAAILNFVLGQYPVPKTFATTEKAAQPS